MVNDSVTTRFIGGKYAKKINESDEKEKFKRLLQQSFFTLRF